ncbi:MAG: hypothetical protein EBR82_24690 [Caulobacteraceae bacterium]|nr:hypothetical protein [Caulobacteraceae bacterium]
MTNKHETGIKIARQLRTTEHAVDTALAEMFRLGAQMVDGRKAANLAAAVGQDSLNEIVSGLSALNTARQATVAAHGGLLEVAQDHNVVWRMDGTTEEKPNPTGGTTGYLAVVA